MKRFLATTASPGTSSDDAVKKAKTTLSPSTYLRLVSYNIDGLDDKLLETRVSEICSILLSEDETPDAPFLPDVVLLQECVEAVVPVLVSRLASAGYALAPPVVPEGDAYFTLAFFHTSRVMVKSATRTPFPGSQMGRDLIKVVCTLKDSESSSPGAVEFLFMTSHLESLGDPRNSKERCQQLGTVLDALLAFPGPALFAGDTNLREKEVTAEPKYKQVIDAWMAAGSPAHAKATWDLSLNDNKKMDNASFVPRMRLDRLLLNQRWVGAGGGKAAEKELVKQWALLGKARMAEGVFPSDHFGLSCLLRLPPGAVGGGGGQKVDEKENEKKSSST